MSAAHGANNDDVAGEADDEGDDVREHDRNKVWVALPRQEHLLCILHEVVRVGICSIRKTHVEFPTLLVSMIPSTRNILDLREKSKTVNTESFGEAMVRWKRGIEIIQHFVCIILFIKEVILY